ncbi:hypothetical protein D9M72_630780 [compost metagenome]
MTRLSADQAEQSAAGKEHDAEQDEAKEELPALGDAAEHVFEEHEDHGAGDRPEQPSLAAENDEHDQFTRHVPGEHRRADEAIEVGIERAGKSGDHGGGGEGDEANIEGRDANGGQTRSVLPRRLQCGAEA